MKGKRMPKTLQAVRELPTTMKQVTGIAILALLVSMVALAISIGKGGK